MADVLEAALRVLSREGAERFTTVRVAEEAGVSIGSLYQYFPNKAALLFRLQTDEWRQTGDILESIFHDETRPPTARLRRAVQVFLRSEREEAELRVALRLAGVEADDEARAERFADDASHATAEAERHRASVTRRTLAFFALLLPDAPEAARAHAAEVVMTSLGSIGERITSQRRPRAELDAWAASLADMYCSWLARLAADADGGSRIERERP